MPSLVQNQDDYYDRSKTLSDFDDEEEDANGEQREDAKREQSKRQKPGGFFCHHDGLQTTNELCTHKCGFLCLLPTQTWILIQNLITITITIRSRRRSKGGSNHPTAVITAPKLPKATHAPFQDPLKDIETPDLALAAAARHVPQAVLPRPFTFEEAKVHARLHH